MVCHDVVRLVPSNRLYIISTVVRSGLPTGGLPRCREVGSIQRLHIISTVVRSGLPTGGLPRCRELGSIQRLHIIFTIVRSGLPTGGLPRCSEVGSIQQVIYYSHGREVGFTDMWFATMS